jgi:hypothetical protein
MSDVFLGATILLLLAVLFAYRAVRNAQLGHEDEEGFHEDF